MLVFFFESEAVAHEAAEVLRGLGRQARQLLELCVQTQGVERRSLSKAAQALADEGFAFIRDESDIFEKKYHITPSLAGEEALEMLEELERLPQTTAR